MLFPSGGMVVPGNHSPGRGAFGMSQVPVTRRCDFCARRALRVYDRVNRELKGAGDTVRREMARLAKGGRCSPPRRLAQKAHANEIISFGYGVEPSVASRLMHWSRVNHCRTMFDTI